MKVLLTILLCLLIVGIVFYGVSEYRTKTIDNFYNVPKGHLSKIEITDGHTGTNSIIVDKDKIVKIENILKTISFRKQLNQERRVGWDKSISLYDGNDLVLDLVLAGNTAKLQEVYYNLQKSFVEDIENVLK